VVPRQRPWGSTFLRERLSPGIEGLVKTVTLGFAVAGLALAGCAAGKRLRPPVFGPKAASAASASRTLKDQTTTVTGTVQEIDADSRQIMVSGPDGTNFTIVIEPDVHDFQGFEKGDEISLTFRESVSFQVKRPDQMRPGVTHTREVTHPSPGEKAGGTVTDTLDIRAPIAAIDRAASAVTVRNIRGEDAVMTLPDSDALDGVAVGDVIDIAYTAAVAITVHRDASRPSPPRASRGPP
jgi:hypothetical protein